MDEPFRWTQYLFELQVGPEWNEYESQPSLRELGMMADLREDWARNWAETNDGISPMKLEPFETHLQSKIARQAEKEARLQAEIQRAQFLSGFLNHEAKAKYAGLCRVCRASAIKG